MNNFPLTRDALIRRGVFPIIDHYYEPLFNPRHLRTPLDVVRDLPGIAFRIDSQLDLLSRLRWRTEIESWPDAELPGLGRVFPLPDSQYGPGDADFLYQFLRLTRPRNVVEIGCGGSSKIIELALAANRADGAGPCSHVCIEPYENPWLERLGVELLRARVEDVDPAFFRALGPGDLLFIDSSHVIRPHGDVLCEFQRVIPSLAAGVFVHVHDIFTPRDYPSEWLVNKVKLWNEQYLFETMLAHNPRYQVVASLNLLKHCEFEALQACCPWLTANSEPGAFYFQIV